MIDKVRDFIEKWIIVIFIAIGLVGLFNYRATGEVLPTWETSQTVYVTNYGSKYHKEKCRYLWNSQKAMDKTRAEKKGYTACSICRP